MIIKITCGTIEPNSVGTTDRQKDWELTVKPDGTGRLLDSNVLEFATLNEELLAPFLEEIGQMLALPHPVGIPLPTEYAEILTDDGTIHDMRGTDLPQKMAQLMSMAEAAGCTDYIHSQFANMPMMGLVACPTAPPSSPVLPAPTMGLFGMGMMMAGMGMRNPDGTWNCSCGETNITASFCPKCAKPAPPENPMLSAQMPAPPKPAKEYPITPWECPSCGQKDITGKFCQNCGEPCPVKYWTCPLCHAYNLTSNFCPECGERKPQ